MNQCYIFGALDIKDPMIQADESDIIIAADSGLNTLKKYNIEPSYIVGDFDSLNYVPYGDNVIKHPVKKDETDTLLAIDIGFEKGFKDFIIYGCIGGRLDHTYANIQASSYVATKGGSAVFISDNTHLTVINNSSISFTSQCEGNISVFAHSGVAKGVNEEGLLYTLKDAELSPDYPLGVSNEFIGKDSLISVKDGSLCIIWESKNGSYTIGGNNE